jgi:hypothetical protein
MKVKTPLKITPLPKAGYGLAKYRSTAAHVGGREGGREGAAFTPTIMHPRGTERVSIKRAGSDVVQFCHDLLDRE